jgi:rhamnogalacturonan endolyase
MKFAAWMPGALALVALALPAGAKEKLRYMERLDRGLIAVQQSDGKVFLSWRLLASDPDGVAFNVYRETERPAAAADPGRSAFASQPEAKTGATLLNAKPLSEVTWLLDSSARLDRDTRYFVAAVVDGVEQSRSTPYRFAAGAPALPYHSIALQTPAGYTPNDASVGDLDGDGQYEIVLHQT